MATFFIILSSIMLSVSTILVKIISDDYSGIFIAICRFLIGIILSVPFLCLSTPCFKEIKWKPLLLRGILGSVSMILFFVSIQKIGAGRATLLLNLYPIFVFIAGILFFSEKLKFKSGISVFLCIMGAVAVFFDHFSIGIMGIILGVLAALFRGLGVHYIKKASTNNNIFLVYLSVCVFGMILFPVAIKEIKAIPDLRTILLLLSVGILSFGAQILLSYGLRFISATKGSIIAYSSIPITASLSIFIGDEITQNYIIGLVLIICGIVINILPISRRWKNEENSI